MLQLLLALDQVTTLTATTQTIKGLGPPVHPGMTFKCDGKLGLERLLSATSLTRQTGPHLNRLAIAVESRAGEPEFLQTSIDHLRVGPTGPGAQHPALRTLLPEHGALVETDDRSSSAGTHRFNRRLEKWGNPLGNGLLRLSNQQIRRIRKQSNGLGITAGISEQRSTLRRLGRNRDLRITEVHQGIKSQIRTLRHQTGHKPLQVITLGDR